MKKQYTTPTMLVVDMEATRMIATSFPINSDLKGDYSEDFAISRRKTWGDLWGDNC